jgi:sugar phosphate isomerase/epimerase
MSSFTFDPATVGMSPGTLLPGHPATCEWPLFERVLRASSAAGFRTLSLWLAWAGQHGIEPTRALLDDLGLSVQVLEATGHWASGPDAVLQYADAQLDAASALGAGIVLAGGPQPSFEPGRAAEGFAAFCERAALHDVRVAIEFIPCRPVSDVRTAWQVVRDSGAENGGIVVDMMHWQYQPGGPDFDTLRAIPGRAVPFVQVCDAPRATPPTMEDYITAAITERALPGEGVTDIAALLAALTDIGAEPYFAYEVFNTELASRGPEEMAAQLAAALGNLPGPDQPRSPERNARATPT